MRTLKWSTSDAVFVAEMDDEHKEIFDAVDALRSAVGTKATGVRKAIGLLADRIQEHFAHEERLMRAARYESFRWHKETHDNAGRRVKQYARRIARGEVAAATELIEYLTGWLPEHTRVADMMLGAFLRNHQRGIYKMTFRAGTRPMESCEWTDSRGRKFNPAKK